MFLRTVRTLIQAVFWLRMQVVEETQLRMQVGEEDSVQISTSRVRIPLARIRLALLGTILPHLAPTWLVRFMDRKWYAHHTTIQTGQVYCQVGLDQKESLQ